MDPYPLKGLLAIREFREEAAKKELAVATLAFKEALRQKEEARNQLNEYQKWRILEKERRYESILGSEMTNPELCQFNDSLAELENKELTLAEELRLAEEQVVLKEKEMDLCREKLKQAGKSKDKIIHHRENWALESGKKEEQAEEKEMEDFRVRV